MELKKYDNDFESLKNFQNQFLQEPDVVKINKLAKNAKYIPIGDVEKKLDEFYFGLWNTKNFNVQIIANEIIGNIELSVFHPIAKVWITRIGAASVMILTKADMPPIVDNKIINTLTRDFPHLKSECIKNAAKSLGVAFGRDLNRDDYGEYEFIDEQKENFVNKLIEIIKNKNPNISEEKLKFQRNNAMNQSIAKLKEIIVKYENNSR